MKSKIIASIIVLVAIVIGIVFYMANDNSVQNNEQDTVPAQISQELIGTWQAVRVQAGTLNYEYKPEDPKQIMVIESNNICFNYNQQSNSCLQQLVYELKDGYFYVEQSQGIPTRYSATIENNELVWAGQSKQSNEWNEFSKTYFSKINI